MNCVIQNFATCSFSPHLPPQALRKSHRFGVLVSTKAKFSSSSLANGDNSKTHLTQLSPALCNANSTQYSSLIQSCIDAHSFDAGKSIHARMVAEGFLPDAYLQTKILMLYARSGELADVHIARAMFDEMTERNSTAWNTMILAYSRGNDHGEVVRLFAEMMRDGASPGKFTFPSVLKGCVALGEKLAVSQVHGLIVKVGLNANLIVGGALVDGYAGFGLMDAAVAALGEIDGGDLVAWNAVLGGYVKLSMREEAWGTFLRYLRVGITPDHFTFAIVIQACGGLRSLSKGKQVHSNLIVRGYASDVFVGNSLIDMYANCGDGDSCRLVFELMTEKNQVSWNSVISSYVQLGCCEEALHLLSRMRVSGLQCDRFNLGSGLVACAALGDTKRGKQLHGYLSRRYLDTTVILGTAVVDMYSKCGSLEEAHHAFDRLDIKSDVSWNALISGYVQEERTKEAIETYNRMRSSVPPDEYTYGSLLSLAANQENEDMGRQIHGYMVRDGSMLNVVVETELVRMYARCGRLREAEVIFSCMQERNSYCWNSLIEGYEENGDYSYALHLFYQMQLNGVNPDCFFLSNALSICTTLSCIARGKQIHGFIIRNALEDHGILRCMLVVMYAQCENMGYACKVYEKTRDKDVFLHNTMISTYLNCGKVSEAGGIFDQMEAKSTVSWNIMLSGYSKAGLKDETFGTFFRMTQEGVNCESSTLVPLFNLCASLPALELGQMLHTVVIKRGLSHGSLILDSVIVDMYSKCGSLKEGRMYFDCMEERNIVTWNSMITAYGKHGQSDEIFVLYKQMLKENIRPNGVTFLSLLSACSHSGLVEEGIYLFITMLKDYDIEAEAEHYTCMVDLLGRAGLVEEAKEVIDNMPMEPEVSTWGALLGACRMHKKIDIARLAAEKLFDLDPDNSGHYILMANIYSSFRMWKEADGIREVMKSRGVKKEPGVSWIRINNEAHTFHAGDQTHPLAEEIYRNLRVLTSNIKKLGYVPDVGSVLRSVNDSEEHLLQHSERLALSLGLIKLHESSVIRIFKNLRICGDCHVAMKLVSKLTGRTIIVRDTNRFHHFEGGICSCGDYW